MNQIKFSKYHACANDFIIIWEKDVRGIDYCVLAESICDRHTGIGADGLIITNEKKEMIFYNQDGSIASMCGNGIRALSLYLLDKKMLPESSFSISTLAGEIKIEHLKNNIFKAMIGDYSFDTKKLMISSSKSVFLNEEIRYMDKTYITSAVYVGVKHLVIFLRDFSEIDDKMGAYFCKYFLFKDDINVDFVIKKSDDLIYVKTYERGVGFTKACGTGAIASVIIGNLYYGLKKRVLVTLEEGFIEITLKNKKAYMVGDANKICDGVYNFNGGLNVKNWKC